MEKMPVCRSVSLNIKGKDRHSGYDRARVTAREIPTKTTETSEYIELIHPGKIQFLGRKKMLSLGRKIKPSSLFFQAVHMCFSEHYPLALRPEVLMHHIVNEIAVTVKMHPDEYRHLFSNKAGRQIINIRHDGLRLNDDSSPWHEALALFKPELEKIVQSSIIRQLLPEFSTHTPETHASSMVAFMDAASPFFDYHSHTMCGIPEIRLLGTPQDYTNLHNAAAELSVVFDKHLRRYFKYLLPVLSKLDDQANGGELDENFWKSIYKYGSASGSNIFNGWLAAFVNYVQEYNHSDNKLVQKNDDAFDWSNCENKKSWAGLTGLSLGSTPSCVSTAPFTWHYFDQKFKMIFIGGVIGIDNEDGYVTPALSYGILE